METRCDQQAPLWANWDYLVGAWRGLNIPEGWRLELIEERLVPASPPEYRHRLIADVLYRHLVERGPGGALVHRMASVVIPSRRSLFIPDLVVAGGAQHSPDPVSVPAETAWLVAEIAAGEQSAKDREIKLWSYAHARVPVYLLIDPRAPEGPVLELHSDPANAAYRDSRKVPFGGVVELPEPIGFILDTAEF
ncbi:Uma2 family endonuclease [Saccharopolyspora taberi]|uniref:Uma2 family endonuclease n=1 Tax=Saccharopolyspora taberi TaxID=60895 RepID=A0ABN3VP37_9PSEU